MGTGSKPPRAGAPPLIELVDCFVRGQGDVVAVGASRPYRLEVKNSLLALTGSLLNVRGNKPGMSATTEANLSLDRVTTYLAQNLVTLQGAPANPVQVPLRVDATGCLFVTSEGKPLLSVDGPESDKELRQMISWRGQRNCYCVPGSLLMWQPFDKALMPHRYDKERWKELWGPDDEQPRFLDVTFKGFLSPNQLAQAKLDDFRIESTDAPDLADLMNCGADLSRLLMLLTAVAEAPSENE
jgi:hypothetical protein